LRERPPAGIFLFHRSILTPRQRSKATKQSRA
jgi:hypothetical protein